MMKVLEKAIASPGFVGSSHSSGGKTYVVKLADNFSYMDPIDQSVAMKQVQCYIQLECYKIVPSRTSGRCGIVKNILYRYFLRYSAWRRMAWGCIDIHSVFEHILQIFIIIIINVPLVSTPRRGLRL